MNARFYFAAQLALAGCIFYSAGLLSARAGPYLEKRPELARRLGGMLTGVATDMSAITTTLLVVHSLIVLALIGIVLIQRSEGGALGIGGGGGGFMSGRGAANVLTRTTSVLAALFFVTSISLAVLAPRGESEADLIRDLTGEELPSANGETSIEDLTRTLGRDDPQPTQTPPAAPAASDPTAEPQSPSAETAPTTVPAPASGETPSAETPAADAQAPEEAPLEPDNESR